MRFHFSALAILAFAAATSAFAQNEAAAGSRWIQPSRENGYQLRWGFMDGIRVGLTPDIIRGLISIYTPYAGQRPDENLNFIAIEPIPKGQDRRGLSELEQSQLDGKKGKRIWTSNDDSPGAFEPRETKNPAPGIVRVENGEETLTVFFFVEPFRNQAKVFVRARFYASKPREVEFATYKRRDSCELASCVVTATMGNYARLRKLYLKGDKIKTASEIWPDYAGNAFAPHEIIATDKMRTGKDGCPYFIAAPDEKNPQAAQHVEGTGKRWRYTGKPVVQYWYCKDPDSSLQGLVNGRIVYWASQTPIPGGIAFENFEMKKQFKNGDRFVYGASPLSAEDFIKMSALP